MENWLLDNFILPINLMLSRESKRGKCEGKQSAGMFVKGFSGNLIT